MSKHTVTIEINGSSFTREVDSRLLLVHFLRENLQMTGTHIGCDTSNCGACTVLMDGRSIKTCTVYTVQANGKSLTTIEGMEQKVNFIRFKRVSTRSMVSSVASVLQV